MDSALQQDYLKSLGIVQYVPREWAVAASESSEREQIGSESRTKAPGQRVEVSAQTASRSAAEAFSAAMTAAMPASKTTQDKHVAALVSLTELSARPAGAKKVPVRPVAAVEEFAQAIEVKFSLWQISPELLVCTMVEGALADRDEMQLLRNLLNAIGCGFNSLPSLELVEWPPYPKAQGDEAEVREFLSSLLHARFNRQPVKSMLVLGEQAARWLLEPAALDHIDNGRVAFSAQTVAITLPSLKQMIEVPQLKSDAWQILQPLLPSLPINPSS
jgi:hypothetical protein